MTKMVHMTRKVMNHQTEPQTQSHQMRVFFLASRLHECNECTLTHACEAMRTDCTRVHLCIHVCVYVYNFYVYMYTYICTYTHTHIYIYTHTHVNLHFQVVALTCLSRSVVYMLHTATAGCEVRENWPKSAIASPGLSVGCNLNVPNAQTLRLSLPIAPQTANPKP